MSQPLSTVAPKSEVQTTPPPSAQKSTWHDTFVEIISGGTGGAVGIFCATPAQYFKVYLQQKANNPQNPPPFQKNPLKWFAGGSGLAGWMFPQAAFTFAMNSWMREQLSNHGERELSSWEKLLCSGATGALTSSLVTPQELIWTQQKKSEDERLKLIKEKNLDPKSVPSKSTVQIVKEIWSMHGFKGFFRAGTETTGREIVSASVLTHFAKDHPVLAPLVGAAMSQPLDGIKTRKQMDFSHQAAVSDLFKAKAFSGLVFGRIPIYLIFMNVAPRIKEQLQTALQDK